MSSSRYSILLLQERLRCYLSLFGKEELLAFISLWLLSVPYRIIRATVSHLNSKITLQREWYFDALSKPLGLYAIAGG